MEFMAILLLIGAAICFIDGVYLVTYAMPWQRGACLVLFAFVLLAALIFIPSLSTTL